MKRNIKHGQLPYHIDLLQGQGRYWFLGKDLQKELGLSTAAIKSALWRLSCQNKICRIKGDFYVVVPPEHRLAGCLPAQWFIEPLMEYLGLPYYVALLSAASLHGAAHQQVMMLQVMTAKPLRKIVVGNQQIQFYVKSVFPENGLTQSKTPWGYLNLSSPELTALDLVKYAGSIDQLQQAATVIYELTENIHMDQLVKVISDNSKLITTVQRLGYLFEEVIRSDLDLSDLKLILEKMKPRYIPLVSEQTISDDVKKNQQWHILINAKIELDDV